MPALESGFAANLLAAPMLVASLHGAPAMSHETVDLNPGVSLAGGLEIPMPYAPQFDADPAAKKLPFSAREALGDFVDSVDAASTEPHEFDVQGFASPDDKCTGNAGLRQDSEANRHLADRRGQVVADALRPILRKKGEYLPVKVLPGHEPKLAKAQQANVADWASAINYKNVGDLVCTWRSGELRYKQPVLDATLQSIIGRWAMVYVSAVPARSGPPYNVDLSHPFLPEQPTKPDGA
jgi:hypothetical protein